jgi:hypothetical protein
MTEATLGIQGFTADDQRVVACSRFSAVRDAVFANPYQKVWGAQGNAPLERFPVTFIPLLKGLLPGGRAWQFLAAAKRVLASDSDRCSRTPWRSKGGSKERCRRQSPPASGRGQGSTARLLRVLLRHEIEFFVVGGVAAQLEGAPILTLDLDVLFDETPENLDRLLAALRELKARYRDPAGRHIEPDKEKLESFRMHLLVTELGALDVLRVIRGGLTYRDLAGEGQGNLKLLLKFLDQFSTP